MLREVSLKKKKKNDASATKLLVHIKYVNHRNETQKCKFLVYIRKTLNTFLSLTLFLENLAVHPVIDTL